MAKVRIMQGVKLHREDFDDLRAELQALGHEVEPFKKTAFRASGAMAWTLTLLVAAPVAKAVDSVTTR